MLVIVFFPVIITAQQDDSVERVTVLDFTAEGGVAQSEAKALTRKFETAVFNTDAFTVVEQSEAGKILEAQNYSLSGCTSDECAVEIGQLRSADTIFLGTVGTIGSSYTITIKLVNVTSGKSMAAESLDAGSLEELSAGMSALACRFSGGLMRGGAGRLVVEEAESAPADSGGGAQRERYVSLRLLSNPDGMKFRILNAAGEQLSDGYTPKALRLSIADYKIAAEDPENMHYPFEA